MINMQISEQIDIDRITLSQDPIFIVGSPRSGTTLLQCLLATQDNLYSLPETHYFNIISRFIEMDDNGFIESACLNTVFGQITKEMGLGFPRRALDRITAMAEEKQLKPKKLFELVIFPCLYEQVGDYDLTRIRWIEKTPDHLHYLEKLTEFYPNSKVVCILRNPIYVAHSRRTHFLHEKDWRVTTFAYEWNHMIFVIEDFKEKYPKRIYLLRYEDLVENVEEQMTSLCRFLDIEIRLHLLEGYRAVSERVILPWEKWKQDVTANKIINRNNLWKKQVGLLDILRIQRITEENMKKYGYEISLKIIQTIFNIVAGSISTISERVRKIDN